jgi:hypothetical protein
VTVLLPSAKAASRWNGALAARLRHAALESFLRSRGQKWVAAGDARITDNLACATLYFVGEALAVCAVENDGSLDELQRSAVAELTCAVSHGLAVLIDERASWRLAALIGTARLLAPHIGIDAAAHLGAATARRYHKRRGGDLDPALMQVSSLVSGAVARNEQALVELAMQAIAERVSSVPDHCSVRMSAPL